MYLHISKYFSWLEQICFYSIVNFLNLQLNYKSACQPRMVETTYGHELFFSMLCSAFSLEGCVIILLLYFTLRYLSCYQNETMLQTAFSTVFVLFSFLFIFYYILSDTFSPLSLLLQNLTVLMYMYPSSEICMQQLLGSIFVCHTSTKI